MSVWQRYQVVLQVQNEFMAGIPKNPDIIKTWLESRKPSEPALAKRQASGEQITPLPELAEKVAEEVSATPDEDKAWLGFKSDAYKGLYIEGSNIKAHLKDCANILQKFLDTKAIRSKLADRVYVEDERVYLGKSEPDAYYEHPVHVMTMQGPRSALKRNDYVKAPRLEFVLRILADDVIKEDLLRTVFEYGGTHGIGAERGLGYGRYTLEEMTKLD